MWVHLANKALSESYSDYFALQSGMCIFLYLCCILKKPMLTWVMLTDTVPSRHTRCLFIKAADSRIRAQVSCWHHSVSSQRSVIPFCQSLLKDSLEKPMNVLPPQDLSSFRMLMISDPCSIKRSPISMFLNLTVTRRRKECLHSTLCTHGHIEEFSLAVWDIMISDFSTLNQVFFYAEFPLQETSFLK